MKEEVEERNLSLLMIELVFVQTALTDEWRKRKYKISRHQFFTHQSGICKGGQR